MCILMVTGNFWKQGWRRDKSGVENRRIADHNRCCEDKAFWGRGVTFGLTRLRLTRLLSRRTSQYDENPICTSCIVDIHECLANAVDLYD